MTGTLHVYKTCNLGSYPCIIRSNDDFIIYREIYKYTDATRQETIKRMKESAGYICVEAKV